MDLLHYSKRFMNRHASTILTCIGGAGVVATSVLAVKATPKAIVLLEQAKEEKGSELTKLEAVKVAGPIYIPAFIVGASTIACIFGANILNKRKQAALMSAYALLDSSYKEYKNKVLELYGEETDSKVREEIARDAYENDQIVIEDDKQLFYDEFSGRYFTSTTAEVIKAEYEINRKISLWGGAYVNEFYEMLDIPPLDCGEQLGWSEGMLMSSIWNKWIDFEHKKVQLDDSLDCFIISMSVDPVFDYEYY